MQSLSAFLRDRLPDDQMPQEEIITRARDVWSDINADVATNTPNGERVDRLVGVCRDIQYAQHRGAHVVTTHRIVALLMLVLARSYGMRMAR